MLEFPWSTVPTRLALPIFPHARAATITSKVQRIGKDKVRWPALILFVLVALIIAIITIVPRGWKTTNDNRSGGKYAGTGHSHDLVNDPIKPNESRRVSIYVEEPPTGWNHQPPQITVEKVSATMPP